MGALLLDLPDLRVVLELEGSDRAVVIEHAMLRTWLAVNGNGSPEGRRKWFAAWRSWFDIAEVKEQGEPTAFAAAQAGLDWLEALTSTQAVGGGKKR